MFIRIPMESGDGRLGGPPARYTPPIDKGGQPVGEGDARHLLTILAGPSHYRPYLARAMAQHITTVPSRFLRIVTDVNSQVPKHLRRLFTSDATGLVGGTIDRWTRTIYMVPAPGLRFETRLEYAIHECVHLFAHPHAPTQVQCPQPCIGTFQARFGRGFGEGLTQLIAEDIMETQGISRYYRDHPYDHFTVVVRDVVAAFGRDAMARAYFFGEVDALRTSMDARWGVDWHAVAGAATAGTHARARAHIQRLESAYTRRIQEMMRQAPKGDFPTPIKARSLA
jgi:hypothetical protein